jgi:hypothetical protein
MSEWSVDTLKEHVDVRFEAVKEAIQVASTVTKERADKLELATQVRFESVNEFRNQTKDLQANFMPRAEFDAAMKSLTEKIQAKNVQIVSSLSVGAVGLLIAVFNLATRLA